MQFVMVFFKFSYFSVILFSPYCSALEGDYTGPTLEDGKITLQFMKELMETYKKQGKLHRKYAYKVSHHSILF